MFLKRLNIKGLLRFYYIHLVAKQYVKYWLSVKAMSLFNELADCLAKNAAKEMIGKKEDFF